MELEEIINQLYFDSSEFYLIFQTAFEAAYEKFELHIPNHPTRPLFRATRLFDPKYMYIGNNRRHSIYQYSIINKLNNPSDNLVHEWGIYCGLKSDENIDESELDIYWNNLAICLPIFSQIVFGYLYLAVLLNVVFLYIILF